MTHDHLYVSDLDGTLLLDNRELSEFTITAIQKFIASNKKFTFATARSLTSSLRYLEALNIQLPVVLYNGALVYDPVLKKYALERAIDLCLANDILAKIMQYNLNPIVHLIDENNRPKVFYKTIANDSEQAYIDFRKRSDDDRFTHVDQLNFQQSQRVIEIMATGTQIQLLPLYNELSKNPLLKIYLAEDIYFKGFYWLEVVHELATKKHGIEFLKSYIGCNEVTCFGDSTNDIPMFEASNNRYAMANAHPALIALAHQVINSNEENAVAHFLANML
jgi:Cof subfamily protein (haloacid dehalogenase superfamily)